MAKKKRNKTTISIVSLVAFIALFGILKATGVVGKEKLDVVEVEAPQKRTITEIITASGKIQPVTEVKISPDVSGEIVELNVKEGDVVKKGDLLLKIKPDVYISIKERTEAALNSSKAQREQIVAQLDQAKANYARNRKLYSQNAITQADYESAEMQYESLKAQLRTADFNIKSAAASLKESDENLYKTTIYAPMNGTVSKLNVEAGERVVGTAQMAGTEMLRIADLSQMEVRAEVNENDIVRVELGDTAYVEVDAYVGKKFKGVVTRIANSSMGAVASTDQVTNFEVRIYIEPASYQELVSQNNPNPFRPGMSASTDIITDTRQVLSIPIQSVTTRPIEDVSTEVVFLYHPDSTTVVMRPVKAGIQDTKFIEVEGISTEDKVITSPYTLIAKKLEKNSKVTVKETKKEDEKKKEEEEKKDSAES